MDISAVAFDLDGTLYPNYKMFIHSLPSAIRYPRLALAFGHARKEIRTLDRIEDFRRTQAELVAKHMRISPEKAEDIIEHHLYNLWAQTFKGIKPYPDARPCIEYIRSRGLKNRGAFGFSCFE
jgi:putative hydrolase of the HAD superfamily